MYCTTRPVSRVPPIAMAAPAYYSAALSALPYPPSGAERQVRISPVFPLARLVGRPDSEAVNGEQKISRQPKAAQSATPFITTNALTQRYTPRCPTHTATSRLFFLEYETCSLLAPTATRHPRHCHIFPDQPRQDTQAKSFCRLLPSASNIATLATSASS